MPASDRGGGAARGDAPRRRLLLAGLAHAALLALAFPPLSLWPLALAASLPVLGVMLRPGARPARDALWVAAGTIPFWAWSHAWILPVTLTGYPFLVLHLAGYVWLALWLTARVARRWPALPASLVVPVLWTGAEFFRGRVLWDGYPWFLAGQPLIDAPGGPALGALGGVYAASAGVALLCGAVLDALPRRPAPGSAPRRRPLAAGAAIALLGAAIAAGVAVRRSALPPPGAPTLLRVAVVQTNVPQDNKSVAEVHELLERWDRLQAMTLAAADGPPPPDLVVWPETMFPGYLNTQAVEALAAAGLAWKPAQGPLRGQTIPVTIFADSLPSLQERAGVPLLVGAEAADHLRVVPRGGAFDLPADARYNSAFLVRGGRVEEDRYDKLHLTPFGEVMPYISAWPALERAMLRFGARGMSFDLAPGAGPFAFTLAGPDDRPVRLATPICFEATSPNVCRRLTYHGGRGTPQRRAEVLVNLTNDGWFGWFDPGRRMHLLAARWRCAELATPMVRAANTGISCVIDASGRLTRQGVSPGGAARVEGIMAADVPPPGGPTPYARFGDFVGWSALAASAAALAGTIRVRKRRGSPAAGR